MEIVTDLLLGGDRLPQRRLEDIDTVVLHSTELPTLQDARDAAKLSEKNGETALIAAHFYIDRDGRIFRFVNEDRIASHVAGHNRDTIGIELVNRGRWPDWFASTHQEPTEPFPSIQIDALKWLLRDLQRRLPSLKGIARHAELDTRRVQATDNPSHQVQRRIDPGPLFPWSEIENFWRNRSKSASGATAEGR